MKRSISKNQGFTLVELLIVVVVIAILAAITIVAYNGVTQKARVAQAQSTLSQGATALAAYQAENGSFPSGPSAAGIKAGSSLSLGYNGGTDYYCLSVSGNGQSLYITNDNTNPQSGDCSTYVAGSTTSCPTGYIAVPGNATFGTNDFCVMKYEARSDTGNGAGMPVSVPTGLPWTQIPQTTAITKAQALGSGYHLITEAEWMTIAANVLSVPSNWSGGAVGSGYIYNGHNDNAPANALAASADDSQGYYGEANTGGTQRRTLILTNGAVIWDFAGNVWEWTQGTIPGNQPGNTSDTGYNWHDYTDTLSAPLASSSISAKSLPSAISAQAGTWNSSQGIGKIYSDATDTVTHAFLRGGSWADGSSGGVLTLNLSHAPSDAYANIGFRVAR